MIISEKNSIFILKSNCIMEFCDIGIKKFTDNDKFYKTYNEHDGINFIFKTCECGDYILNVDNFKLIIYDIINIEKIIKDNGIEINYKELKINDYIKYCYDIEREGYHEYIRACDYSSSHYNEITSKIYKNYLHPIFIKKSSIHYNKLK